MGIFDNLKKILPKVTVSREYLHAPSNDFTTPVDLMVHLIERITPDAWASFEAGDHIIQVTGKTVNTCTESVDVAVIAHRLGLTELAQAIVATDNDRTMHELPNASTQEMAQVVNGIFVHHYGMPPGFRMEGWLEG